jgi:hypothetical protein
LRAAGTVARVHDWEVYAGGDFGTKAVDPYHDGSGGKIVSFKLGVHILETTGYDALELALTCARDNGSSTKEYLFYQQL